MLCAEEEVESENMAKEDLNKFRELLTSDADFQTKFRIAAEQYTGEKNEKAVFDNLLKPFAEENGLSATYEEFSEFISAFSRGSDSEISEDELAQVAGGKGSGAFVCGLIGGGFGSTNEYDTCVVVGFGLGICVIEGASY